MPAADAMAPEQTSFELERFQWPSEDRLEVEGRWYGVRGRRFVRPVLTVEVAGNRRRLLALLEHKPWAAGEGESWIAAFKWAGPRDEVGGGELEVGSLTVDLPPPGGKRTRSGTQRRRKAESSASEGTRAPGSPAPAASAPTASAAAPAPAPAAADKTAPPMPADSPNRHVAGESRGALERDLAGARAELGRIRIRHEEELRELRAAAEGAGEPLEAARREASQLRDALEQAQAELGRLRDELAREGADRHRSETELREERDAARAELGARESAAAGAEAAVAEALERAQAEHDDALAAARAEHDAEIAAAREEAERARAETAERRAEIDGLRRQVERERDEHLAAMEHLRSDLERRGADRSTEIDRLRDEHARERGGHAAALDEARGALAAAQAERDQARTELEKLRAAAAAPATEENEVDPPRAAVGEDVSRLRTSEKDARGALAEERASRGRLEGEVERLRSRASGGEPVTAAAAAASLPPARTRALPGRPVAPGQDRTPREVWGPRIAALAALVLLVVAILIVAQGL